MDGISKVIAAGKERLENGRQKPVKNADSAALDLQSAPQANEMGKAQRHPDKERALNWRVRDAVH